MAKLYDLEADPYEERNLVSVRAMAGIVAQAKAELARSVLESLGLA